LRRKLIIIPNFIRFFDDFEQKIGIKKSFPVTILGISAIITQIVTIREFQSVLNGNELIYGLIFAVWMTITATGARIGKYLQKKSKLFLE